MKLGLGLGLHKNRLLGGIKNLFTNIFPGAGVAWSLQLVNNLYKGFIITVRRSSDNAQKGFYFLDIIGNVMKDWVNTPLIKFESDFVSGSAQFNYTERVTLETGETIGGKTNVVKITLTGGNSSHRFGTADFIEPLKSYDMTFDLYIPSSNSQVNQIYIQRPVSNQYVSIDPDTWVSLSFTGTNDSNNDMLFLAAKDNNITIDADGDVLYMKNVILTQTTADGFVPTIFDQISSHNMEQPLSSLQGSIMLNGVVNLKGGKPCILRSLNVEGGYLSTYKPNDGSAVKGLFYVGDNESRKSVMLGSDKQRDFVYSVLENEFNIDSDINARVSLTQQNINNIEVNPSDRGNVYLLTNLQFLAYFEIEFDYLDNVLGIGYRQSSTGDNGMFTFQQLVIFENTDDDEAKRAFINNYYQIF
jgi:hypothetical protein